jgi:hypothetical protein
MIIAIKNSVFFTPPLLRTFYTLNFMELKFKRLYFRRKRSWNIKIYYLIIQSLGRINFDILWEKAQVKIFGPQRNEVNKGILHTEELHNSYSLSNIKIELREVYWGDIHWIYLARDRDQWRDLVKTVMNLLNFVAFSPQANYTDRATAACRRS